jgi:hypothetical protein
MGKHRSKPDAQEIIMNELEQKIEKTIKIRNVNFSVKTIVEQLEIRLRDQNCLEKTNITLEEFVNEKKINSAISEIKIREINPTEFAYSRVYSPFQDKSDEADELIRRY